MALGVLFALIAGLAWGLVFVAPLMLPDYPATLLAMARYLAFGVLCLPLAWFDRTELHRLSRADWLEALKLAAIGNLLYYSLLASSIQRTGGPLTTLLIGALPVVIAIAANQRNATRDGHLPWRQLVGPLLLILLGIACVNHVEMAWALQQPNQSLARYASGAVLGVGALICWTWYPLRNADWMRHHPSRSPRAWATAQGLVTLPLAAAGYAVLWGTLQLGGSALDMPLGPQPQRFVLLMVAIGLLGSWVGTLCWNAASQRLPTAVAGQLIVFETLAALLYAYLWRAHWPTWPIWLGIALLLIGVLLGVRIKPQLNSLKGG